jgi:hypothetical protein
MKFPLACLLCGLGSIALAQTPAPGSPGTATPQPYTNPAPQPRPADPGKPALFKRPQPANNAPPPNPGPGVEQPHAPVDRSADR